MYRLRYGGPVDALILANNARTSVDMLERFYLSKLESSHVTDALHSKKPVRVRRKKGMGGQQSRTIIVTAPEPVEGGGSSAGTSGSSRDAKIDFGALGNLVEVPKD